MRVHGLAADSLSELVVKVNEWIGETEKARKLVIDIQYDSVVLSQGVMFTALITYNG